MLYIHNKYITVEEERVCLDSFGGVLIEQVLKLCMRRAHASDQQTMALIPVIKAACVIQRAAVFSAAI